MTQQAINLTVFGRTDVGKVRKNNEDAFVIADLTSPRPPGAAGGHLAIEVGERGVLLAVSDGMGGQQAGEVASALALQSLRRGMNEGASSAEAALQASVENANQKVWNAASEPGHRGMGATLTAVLIVGLRAYIAEIGDSRAYLLRGDHFVQLTHDQSYVQILLDSGKVTREQAERCEYKNVILQAIGTKPDVVVALNWITLRRNDRFLLCSDGLSGTLEDDEMHRIVAAAPTLESACDALIARANERGGDDNITVVLGEVDGEGLPASTGTEPMFIETVQSYPP